MGELSLFAWSWATFRRASLTSYALITLKAAANNLRNLFHGALRLFDVRDILRGRSAQVLPPKVTVEIVADYQGLTAASAMRSPIVRGRNAVEPDEMEETTRFSSRLVTHRARESRRSGLSTTDQLPATYSGSPC